MVHAEPGAVPTTSRALTLATDTRSSIVDREVRAGKRMALRAVRLRRVACRDRVALQRVLTLGRWLKMPRVHARPVAAQMVDRQPLGDRADEDLVGHPVRHLPEALGLAFAVPLRVPKAKPEPASAWSDFDLRPDPLSNLSASGFAQHSAIIAHMRAV